MNPRQQTRRQALIALGGGGLAVTAAGLGILDASGALGHDLSLDLKTLPSGYHPRVLNVEGFMRFAENIEDNYRHDTGYIPPGLRQLNTDGSCVHLSTRNHLFANGLWEAGKDWKFRNGEYSGRHIDRMKSHEIEFCVETNGDARFLDWACGNTGAVCRGAGITLLAPHMVNLLDMDPANFPKPQATILNNWGSGDHHFAAPKGKPYDRDWLIRDWRNRGGWAFAVVAAGGKQGSPAPPIPYSPPDSPYRG